MIFEILKNFTTYINGITILVASLLYLGAKKYIEKYAENLAERHTKGWKEVK